MEVTLIFIIYFFWILSAIKMKFGQILVCWMTNISNLFLAQCWRMETRCRPFYDIISMAVWQDLAIFNNWHLPFLIVPCSPLQKNEALKSWHNWSPIEKDLELSLSPPSCSKDSWKLLSLHISTNWPSLVTLWVLVQKICSKMYPVSCTNTYHNVTDLVNYGMGLLEPSDKMSDDILLTLCLLFSFCFIKIVSMCFNKNLICISCGYNCIAFIFYWLLISKYLYANLCD